MMNEIQSNLKCLGLLEPYFWKKGEACAVRGSDTMWYRGKVMELGGGTIRVSLIFLGDRCKANCYNSKWSSESKYIKV